MSKLVRFDWAIKHLLRNKANFDVLEGFLSELLKIPVQIERVIESESNKNHVEDKFNRVDLLAIADQDRQIIIEVQCSSQWDYLSRILYGTSKLVCESIREGEAYRNITKVISVSIVFFNLGEGQDYLYQGTTVFKGLHYHDILGLHPKERSLYAEKQALGIETPEAIFPEYYLIKVTKFQDRVKDKLDEWVYLLKHDEVKEEFTARGIQSAAQKLNTLRLSEADRRAYERYQDSLHDEGSALVMVSTARAEGEAIGLEKGETIGLEKGRAEGDLRVQQVQEESERKVQQAQEKSEFKAKQTLARKLLAKNMPLDEITELTDLPLGVVQQLLMNNPIK